MGFAGHFAGDTETRVYGRAAFGHQWEGLRGHWVCGDTETRVCSQSSVLGISERDSVVHVDVVSINAD